MAFHVEIAPRALEDLDEIAGHIAQNSGFRQAEAWFNGILNAIQLLEAMPTRCPICEESKGLGNKVRILLYGRRARIYKIFFLIESTTRTSGKAHILHVRQWARRDLTSDEVGELTDTSPGARNLGDQP